MVENLQEQHPEQGEVIPLTTSTMVKYLSMSSKSATIIFILRLITDFYCHFDFLVSSRKFFFKVLSLVKVFVFLGGGIRLARESLYFNSLIDSVCQSDSHSLRKTFIGPRFSFKLGFSDHVQLREQLQYLLDGPLVESSPATLGGA